MWTFIKQIFTWWNGQTLGTRFYGWWRGERVGEDEFGNVYYRAPSAVPRSIPERRWVVYSGYAEASTIPPGWHGWIHHKVDLPPSEATYHPQEWEKPHKPNLTGTAAAYRPPGSVLSPVPNAAAEADYEPWTPG